MVPLEQIVMKPASKVRLNAKKQGEMKFFVSGWCVFTEKKWNLISLCGHSGINHHWQWCCLLKKQSGLNLTAVFETHFHCQCCILQSLFPESHGRVAVKRSDSAVQQHIIISVRQLSLWDTSRHMIDSIKWNSYRDFGHIPGIPGLWPNVCKGFKTTCLNLRLVLLPCR